MSDAHPLARDILAFDRVEVVLKETWQEGSATSWINPNSNDAPADLRPARYVEVVGAAQSISPEGSRAELLYRYGNIKRQGLTDFILYAPLSLEDWFIRIDKVKPDNSRVALWLGIIGADEREVMGGGLLGDGATGDQRMMAFGLELLLDRVRINTSWMTNNGTSEQEIEFVPVFNEQFIYGFKEIGNRSADQITRADGDSYVFAKDASVWTVRDIVQYLLTHYKPGGVKFDLVGATADLANIMLPAVDLRGMTLREALNHLIDRRRGLGWCVRYQQAGSGGATVDKAQIHVFTVIDTNAVDENGEVVLRANPETATFDIDRIDANPVITVRDSLNTFGTVRILGRNVVSCFTLKCSDETMVPAWSVAEEDAYKAVSGSTNEEKDAERTADKYHHVYQSFLLNIKNNAGERYRNPKVQDDGTIDPTTQAAIRQWGHARTFLPTLPLAKPWTRSGVKPEFREPFALVEYTKAAAGGTAVGFIDKILGDNTPTGYVRMLDNQLGVHIDITPNHALAKGHFGTSAATSFTPAYDYNTLTATVAMETDERLKYIMTIADNDAARVLTIDVEDAELWWIAKGTITDVSASAAVVHNPKDENLGLPYTGTSGTNGGSVIRNDISRLKRIGAAAKAWYGRKRTAVTLQVARLLEELPPGTFLRSVEDPTQFREVGAVVSSREWDFTRSMTRISTGFAEMDFTLFR